VDALYSNKVSSSLEKSGFVVKKFVFENGESSKNVNTFTQILSCLAKNEFTRTDCIVALGGGVVGDIAGFSASAYLRGIKFVQIPTTLLAQIDSSVGGKTAIDIPEGKNLVGAFYQPSLVIADTDCLSTLNEQIYLDGMGEGVKYAILDKKIWGILSSDNFSLIDFVSACVSYKAKIVKKDEFEKNIRKYLNLGHTIAHGIEILSELKVSHGKAVCMGIEIIAKTSFKHGFIDEQTLNQVLRLLNKKVGDSSCPYDITEVLKIALVDKKRKGDYITLVMIGGVGKPILEKVKIDSLTEYFV
jgi:3-dehydroquinate synthase